MQEQTIERFRFYNEELSILTTMIVLLTVLSSILIITTFIYSPEFTTTISKTDIFLASLAVLGVIIIIIAYLVLWKLPKLKRDMKDIVFCETRIINGILDGDETDVQCILRRYHDCFKEKR